MSSAAELHAAYRIANAPMNMFPYPHIYVRDVFPADFYTSLIAHLPPPQMLDPISDVRPVSKVYGKTRSVLILSQDHLNKIDDPYKSFWSAIGGWLLGGKFTNLVFTKFAPLIKQRFPDMAAQQFYDEALLVQDSTDYALGPHTDSPIKVLSMLFYLPPDDSMQHLGTSLYIPKESTFTCPGGPHHPFDKFNRVMTMPYLPNSMFAFIKTANAFHGVEPIQESGIKRSLLLYDIKVKTVEPAIPAAPSNPPPAGAGVKFSF